ncbi:hypothetical protein KY333_03720 [Candidatus Woesearchaeota archaeon]|nr:hypothetical protein [Candidatus Woesearchaeota archaeon]
MVKTFQKVICEKIDVLRLENKRLIQEGKKHELQVNCNFLRGIDFVVSVLKKRGLWR